MTETKLRALYLRTLRENDRWCPPQGRTRTVIAWTLAILLIVAFFAFNSMDAWADDTASAPSATVETDDGPSFGPRAAPPKCDDNVTWEDAYPEVWEFFDRVPWAAEAYREWLLGKWEPEERGA